MESRSGKNPTSVSPSGTEVFLALGSNKGDREAFFRLALDGLSAGGLELNRLSPLYETDPVDCEPGVPPFLNAVLFGIWRNTPETLLDLCQKLERQAGRPEKHSSRQSRELDLDIILFGQQILHTARLTVPHPRAAQRGFVLIPLHDIAPSAVFPDCGRTVGELLSSLPPDAGVVRSGILTDLTDIRR